jgi:hypothetical protein
MKAVSAAWQKAGQDLGIRIEAPFQLPDESGKICHFAAYVPDFGSPKGILVLVIKPPDFKDDEQAKACAEHHGYWVSSLNADAYSSYNRDEFINMLDDWQYFGSPQESPSWYTGAPWGSKQQ